MIKILSAVESGTLLHIVYRLSDFRSGRQDIAPDDQFLQCAALKLPEGKTFRPHKHIYKPGEEKAIAQESWVVLKGRVRVYYYDLDDKIVSEQVLEPGDLSMTFRGGHNYLILENDTIVYEFKTGPYYGQAQDKEFIDQ